MKKTIIFSIIHLATIFLTVGCANHYTNSELVDIFSEKGLTTKETDRGVVVFLPEVFFEFNSFELTETAENKLATIGDVLIDPKTVSRQIMVEGHTDSIGDKAYNEELSLQRANVVADELVERNVSNERISRRGYGEKYPIAPNTKPDGRDNPDGRAQNRRVEIVVENIRQPN